MAHGYTWADVLRRPASELQAGDVVIRPGMGTAYRFTKDGRVRGVGWLELDGTAFAIAARDGDVLTYEDEAGQTIAQPIPTGVDVLRVKRPGERP